jgi:hypothetical protein
VDRSLLRLKGHAEQYQRRALYGTQAFRDPRTARRCGGIKNVASNGLNRFSLVENTFYGQFVHNIIDMANSSQDSASTTDDFARRVMESTLKTDPPRYLSVRDCFLFFLVASSESGFVYYVEALFLGIMTAMGYDFRVVFADQPFETFYLVYSNETLRFKYCTPWPSITLKHFSLKYSASLIQSQYRCRFGFRVTTNRLRIKLEPYEHEGV